jgi:BspA type Leucine rich repeat region (6 copies)
MNKRLFHKNNFWYKVHKMRFLSFVKISCFLCAILLPATVEAQFTYTTNDDGTLNITGYAGSSNSIIIPCNIDGQAVTSIGGGAFEGSSDISSVTIPGSVSYIGNYAFFFCSSLTSVFFQGNPPSVGASAFGTLTFPNPFAPPGLTYPNCYYLAGTIGWASTFAGCPVFLFSAPFACMPTNGTIGIVSYMGDGGAVVIPQSIDSMPVVSIGDNAFAGSSISSITIPDSVTQIGDDAFATCGLSTITFPNSITSIGDDAFFNCGNLTNINFPNNGALNIGNWSFLGCGNLTTLIIPNGVSSVGYYAFGQCGALTNVTVYDSVTGFGQFAFMDCPNLTSVNFIGNAPGADWTVFMNDNQAVVYYLPGTTGWGSTFGGAPTAQLYLPSPVILNFEAGFGVNSSGFGFVVSWATNSCVAVEASTALAAPKWCTVATNSLSGGWFYFNDPQWTNYSARFYRLRSP